MKRIFVCLLICCITHIGLAQEKLTKLRLNKEIEVKVPASFSPMSEQEIVSRYLSNSIPLAVYGNERRTSDFGISKNATRWSMQDSEILKDFYKASILSTYTEVKFFQEELVAYNDQVFILFEFQSYFKDEDSNAIATKSAVNKYTYIMYGIRDGSLYVFNFNAPATEREYWQKTVGKMMQSIKFL